MNNYQEIKNCVFLNLKKSDNIDIKAEIDNIKQAMQIVGLDIFAKIIKAKNLQYLPDSDWQKMRRELETQFNVKMEYGVLINSSK